MTLVLVLLQVRLKLLNKNVNYTINFFYCFNIINVTQDTFEDIFSHFLHFHKSKHLLCTVQYSTF